MNDLLNASDNWVLEAYRAFRQHRDVVQLRDDLLECANTRASAAAAVAATGIDNFFPRMTAFVEHKLRTGYLTEEQAEVLISLIESGSAAIISAYHHARERDDPDALFEGMLEIANFYLKDQSSPQSQSQQPRSQVQVQSQNTAARPDTPEPYYQNEDANGEKLDDLIDLYEELIDANLIPAEFQDDLRNIILSDNPYVTAAVELYRATDDFEDFVDTLLRIINHQRGGNAVVTPQDVYDEQQKAWQVEEGEGEEEVSNGDNGEEVMDDEEEEEMSWEAIEGTVRLLDSLMTSKIFTFEETKRLSMLLLSDYISTQQEVLVAAYQLYEHDGDIEEFVDTCQRVLRQLSELNQRHLGAYRQIVMEENRFSDYQQALLVTMWNGLEPRVMAAWDVFVYDQNEAELVDTLSRIVSHEFEIEEEEEEETNEAIQAQQLPASSPARNPAHKRNYSQVEQEEPNGDTTYHEVMEQVIDLMLVEQVIDDDGADVLRTLVLEGHTIVAAAYDAFSHDEDIDELMDTLTTVIEYGKEKHDGENVVELLHFVEHSVSKGRLTPAEGADAAWLIELRDPRIMAAYDLYYEEQDVDDLIETIRMTVHVEREPGIIYDGANDEDEDERRRYGEEKGGESDGKDDDEEEEEEYARAVENARQVVRACHERGELNEEDAVALMEAPDDPRLLAAVDNFATDGEWDELCDTLRRLGGHLNGTYGYDDRGVVGGEQEEVDNVEVDDDDLEEWMEEHAEANGYKMSYDTEAITTDYTDGDGLDDSEDDEDFYRGEGSTSQIAAAVGYGDEDDDDSVQEVDVGDLVLQMNLNSEEKLVVYDLLRREDPIVNAAFEIYEADGDLHDLNDTLKRVVSRYLPRQPEQQREEEDEETWTVADERGELGNQVFGALFRSGQINEEEKERFVMLLAGGHLMAEAALEVFGLDGDSQDFVDTMRRIS